MSITNLDLLYIFNEGANLAFWAQRVTGSDSDAYDTGSAVSFGYGDTPIRWTGSIGGGSTGSWIKIFVRPVRAEEIVLEAGFLPHDYRIAYFSGSTNIQLYDLLFYPSGSTQQKFIIQPPQEYVATNDLLLLKQITIRCLVPSGV